MAMVISVTLLLLRSIVRLTGLLAGECWTLTDVHWVVVSEVCSWTGDMAGQPSESISGDQRVILARRSVRQLSRSLAHNTDTLASGDAPLIASCVSRGSYVRLDRLYTCKELVALFLCSVTPGPFIRSVPPIFSKKEKRRNLVQNIALDKSN